MIDDRAQPVFTPEQQRQCLGLALRALQGGQPLEFAGCIRDGQGHATLTVTSGKHFLGALYDVAYSETNHLVCECIAGQCGRPCKHVGLLLGMGWPYLLTAPLDAIAVLPDGTLVPPESSLPDNMVNLAAAVTAELARKFCAL